MQKRVWAALIGAGFCMVGIGLGSSGQQQQLAQVGSGFFSLAIGCVALTEARRLVRAS